MALVYASGGRTLCASRSIAQVGDLSAPVQCNTVGKRSRPAGLGGPSCGTLEGRPSDSAMCRQKRVGSLSPILYKGRAIIEQSTLVTNQPNIDS